MTFRYINTTPGHTFNVDLGTSVVRLGSITSGFVERAELGEPGMGGVDLDDPDGTLNILGLQYFHVDESAVVDTNNNVIWYGFIGDRTVTRGDSGRPSLVTAAARVWSLDLIDFNTFLSMRMLVTSGANRPAETGSARLTWLLGLGNCPFHDYGLVSYPGHAMDANDYSGQTFRDVLADISAAIARNYYLYYSKADGGIGLAFYDQDGTTNTTTAKISDSLPDIDGTTVFYPLDTSLARSASRIASGVWVAYSGGHVYVTRSTTSDQFAVFDHAAPNSNVHSSAKATTIANKLLDQSDAEDDRITTTIRVPIANVNDIRAGHRMQVKFTFLPGYESYLWCRVMSRAVLQDEESDDFYKLRLEIVPIAQPAPPPPPTACSIIGVAPVAGGTYGPNLSHISDSTGRILYFRGGIADVNVPTPGYVGDWHFALYNQAGIDYAGDSVGNYLRIFTVGLGTITATVGNYGVTMHTFNATIQHYNSGSSTWVVDQTQTGLPAGPITFTVPVDSYCYHRVEITDDASVAGSKWGFVGYVWTPA